MLDRLFENIMFSYTIACGIRDSTVFEDRIDIQSIYSSSYLLYKIMLNTVQIELTEVIIPIQRGRGNFPITSRPLAVFHVSPMGDARSGLITGIIFWMFGGNINKNYFVNEFSGEKVNPEEVKKLLSYFEFNQKTLELLNDKIEKLNLKSI